MNSNGKLLVYRASAGSGKTYQLALTYIKLLLGYFDEQDRYHLLHADDPKRHREILAITFTNKATAEMRSRIIDELAKLASPKGGSKYLPTFRELIGTDKTDASVDNEIHQAAHRALNSMLFDLGEIQISTIDAFFQRVLRSFAYEADLAGNYELSLEDKLMTQQSINDLLAIACGYRSVVSPKNIDKQVLSRRLSSLIVNEIDKGAEYKLFNSESSLRKGLIEFVASLSGEDYQLKREEIEGFLLKPNAVENLEKSLKKKANELDYEISSKLKELQGGIISDYFSLNFSKAIAKFEKSGIQDLTDANFRYFSPDSSNRSSLIVAAGKKKFPAETERFIAEMQPICDSFKQLCSIQAILNNIKYLGLFHDVLKVQQALKVHTNTVMLSDTNTLLNKIIGDSETPFIYERIGRQLHHFLIDEFQDTSRLQWENLKPLLKESLAVNSENLIIGDVKQCIYRFRNSDPKLLAHDLERTPGISDNFNPKSLDSNWRSSKTIVDFNNLLFERVGTKVSAMVNDDKAGAYRDVAQKAPNGNVPGYINAALYEDGDAVSLMPIDRMLKHIARQLASGYRPGEIVVLVDTNSQATEVVGELLAAVSKSLLPLDTQVLSDEALMVSSAKSVRWIVSRLQQMQQLPEKKEETPGKMPQVTEFDLDYINERISLYSKEEYISDPVEQAIEDFRTLQNNGESVINYNVRSRRSRANGQSLFEIVQGLIAALPIEDWRASEAIYLNAFQDLVMDYCRGRAPSLSGFVALWEEKLADKAAVGLSEGVNAIRVMTIHKSKGLEFKCVHLPYITGSLDVEKTTRWYAVGDALRELDLGVEVPLYFPFNALKGNLGKMPVEYTPFGDEVKRYKDDQTIDRLNALYVAFTRAERELIVTLTKPKKNQGKIAAEELLWPEIMAIQPPADADVPVIEIGAATKPVDNEENNQKSTINLGAYTTRKRTDMWANTKAAQHSDSGEPA